jgi:hypothetical protein
MNTKDALRDIKLSIHELEARLDKLEKDSHPPVLWLLKKIPNKDLYAWVKTGAYWAGTAMTLGLSKFKWTKSLWNSTVEPYFIDLIDNTVGAAVQGFIDGLKSDK